ncbi:hypothetical protein O0L34_g18862 [Tuta absoluta]|nr:hypothetical protein O0L34_g18862 [Tuta absoluta]
MSSASPLDSEELENVPLVRMEDVQPDRSGEKMTVIFKNRIASDCISQSSLEGSVETFFVDNTELHCIDDDDSNIGSMVSIKSEEIVGESEMIVPEVLDSIEIPLEDETSQSPQPPTIEVSPNACQINIMKPSAPDSWPTLEILPGGVINLAEKTDFNVDPLDTDVSDGSDMIYACAKCSQSFKYLFCLVKHVRWHEAEALKEKVPQSKLTPIEKKMAELEKRGNEMDKIMKTQKGILHIKAEPKQKTAKQTAKEKYICLHTGKRKIVQKPRTRTTPKKS